MRQQQKLRKHLRKVTAETELETAVATAHEHGTTVEHSRAVQRAAMELVAAIEEELT